MSGGARVQGFRAYGYAAAAIACWSTVATAFKLALRSLTPVELLLVAAWTSTAVLLAVLAAGGRLRDLARWRRRDWLQAAALGALNPFLYYMVLFRAYDLLPAQEAQPLNYTWPIVLVLLSTVFLGERMRWRTWLALLMSFAGVAVISTHGDFAALRFSSVEGVLLAVGSSVLWAVYWIANLRGTAAREARLFVAMAAGSVLVTAWHAATGAWRAIPLEGLLGGAYVGCFEMGVTFLLWMGALRNAARTALVSNLVYLAPFLSLLVISAVLGERILPSTLLGLVLIVAGILVQQTAAMRRSAA
jgi:drug/metabolite transporter (DMT)-like permease